MVKVLGQCLASFALFQVLIPTQISNFDPGGQTLDEIVCLEETVGNPNPQVVETSNSKLRKLASDFLPGDTALNHR